MTEQELRDVFSSNIKFLRNKKGFSQAKLAEKVDISSNFVSELETGKGWVSPQTLVSLAGALEVEVHSLFKVEDPKSVSIAQITESLAVDITRLAAEAACKIRFG